MSYKAEGKPESDDSLTSKRTFCFKSFLNGSEICFNRVMSSYSAFHKAEVHLKFLKFATNLTTS